MPREGRLSSHEAVGVLEGALDVDREDASLRQVVQCIASPHVLVGRQHINQPPLRRVAEAARCVGGDESQRMRPHRTKNVLHSTSREEEDCALWESEGSGVLRSAIGLAMAAASKRVLGKPGRHWSLVPGIGLVLEPGETLEPPNDELGRLVGCGSVEAAAEQSVEQSVGVLAPTAILWGARRISLPQGQCTP
eukprot:scaffold6934_cov66-Phaeocystis_antarctica.AAC.4